MKLIKIAFLTIILITNSYLCNAFEVIEGEITEIAGPDDLNLDPDKVIIAIDVFGNADSIINGVEFYTDRDGLGAQTIGEGMVEKDGVSVTSTSTHTIDNWSNGGGGPSFTGDDADSVSNLSEVMRDIRWSAAPSPVTIDINGLNAGSIYNVQLLFNEGADRNRGWDIAVNDELAVDNITSEGGDGFWTPENSFVYSGNFSATDDGIIAISMQNDIGGAAQVAADGNPILQGIILNSMTPSSIISFVGPLTDDESTGISPDNTYTHTISGGGAETVNGVEFELLNDATTPEDFYWDVSSVKNQLDNNNGGWDVGSSGVTGPGLQALLGSFTFNNDGAVGSNQTFTLSGLTEGQYYELRLYSRKWDNSTQRQQTIEFISGESIDTVTFSEDHPETEPVNMESRDQAYYISYRYTAGDDEELLVKFTVTDDEVQGAPGSFHMYGLTNQIAAPPSDLDQDGLPDSWEERIADNLEDLNGNAAGPGPGSGTGDFDGDGLTDLDEYEETKTNPIVADTDEDGLLDGVETNTGTYVSATNTGTDPKNADSDGDGLLDGVETNSGTLVDEEDTGTDPHNADTDGDGYGDGGEIVGGTDPHDPNSKGAIPPPFLYVDFEGEATDLSGNDYNGEVDGAVSFDVEGAEGGPTPTTGANFTGGHLDFFDIDMNSMISNFEDGSYTFTCWMKPIGSAGGEGFMWGQTNQGIHNGIRNGGLLHSAHWGADWNASTVLEAEQWVHAAWVYDGAADTASIYLNGQLDGGPQAQRAPNGGGTLIFGGRNNGEIPYNGYVDDVTIWREVLPEGTIQALADGASPIGASQEDEDGDGLPDSWEEKYGVDDPEGDDDNDGLTNIEEFEARTKPNKADSDDDGLSDKAEIEEHKTNPLNPDADRDGLLDGAEVAAGTDPDNRDTDGDGITDFNEIQDGTDPLVVTAIAFETNLVSYWPLDSDFDDAQAENHGVEEGGPIEFQTGKFDGSVYLNGSQSIEITGDENTFDFAGESFTVSAWYTAEAINKSWQCLVAKGEGNGWRVHRRGGDNPPEMTFTGGNGDVDRHNVAMTVGGDPETWHHVAGVTDSDTQEEILYLDGEEVARKAGATLQDRGNPMRIGDNPDARNRNWQGKVDDVAVWGRALQPNEIAEIWDGGSGKSIEDMLGLSVPFDFTSVIYDAQEDSFRFEWNSKPNRTYALYFSETLEEFDADVDDSIESGGETTVYPPIGEPGLENPLEGVRKIFFRIEENQ